MLNTLAFKVLSSHIFKSLSKNALIVLNWCKRETQP